MRDKQGSGASGEPGANPYEGGSEGFEHRAGHRGAVTDRQERDRADTTGLHGHGHKHAHGHEHRDDPVDLPSDPADPRADAKHLVVAGRHDIRIGGSAVVLADGQRVANANDGGHVIVG